MEEVEDKLIELLMGVFQHLQQRDNYTVDYDELIPRFEEQGFDKEDILMALDWLADLVEEPNVAELGNRSIRVFSPEERRHLDTRACNCLIRLEKVGILTPATRERVIEQVVALHSEGVKTSLVKWVTFLVLCSYPEQERALQRMELYVADEFQGGVQ